MKRDTQAQGPGETAPTSDEGPTVATVALLESKQDESRDSRSALHSGQALRVIEGEGKATDYLARLHAQQADPDELALIVSMMYGAMLRGFCRVIEKTLRGRHA